MKYLPCGFILCVCNVYVNPCNKDLWFTVNFHRTWQPRELTEILTLLSEKHWGTEQRFASERLKFYFCIYGVCDYCKLQGFEGVRTCLPSESLQTIVRRIVTTKVQYCTLSREKTFVFCGYLQQFSLLSLGAWYSLVAQSSSLQKFSPQKLYFSPLCKNFSFKSVPLYSRWYM